MNDRNTIQPNPNPDSQLESAISAVVAQPLDQEAIDRVKVRAKELGPASHDSVFPPTPAKVSTASKRQISSPTSNRFKSSFWMSAIAASLILAVGLSMLLTGNKSAFANAIEKLKSARTLTFMMETKVDAGETDLGDINVDSKGQVFAAKDGRWRYQRKDSIVVTDANGNGLILDESTKEAIPFTRNEMDDNDFNTLDWFEKLKTSADKPVKRLGKKTLSGVEVEGFVVHEPLEVGEETTIWVDTKSNQLVQVELEHSQDDITVKMIMNDFKYDVPLKDSLFNLDIPAGYTVGEDILDFDSSEALVEGLRKLTANLDGVFPQNLTEPKFDMTNEQAMVGFFEIGMFLHPLEKDDYEYVGSGKTRDGERSMVFWYRQNGKLQAIYSDLTVAEISKDEIPTK